MSSIKDYRITPVSPIIQHGEGPVWEPKEGVLYYVDTFQATVYKWNPKTNALASHRLEERNTIGTIMPIKNKPNQFIVSADRYIYHFAWDGLQNNSAEVTELLKIDEGKPKNQFNDGKADVNGNIWLGTLTREDDLGVTTRGGSLYKFIPKKNFKYEEVTKNVGISNGITWSRDNKYMFYIDSSDRTVERWNFDESCSTISNKTVLFDLAKYPHIKGILDGMTCDSEDNLYVAGYGGSSIYKIHPETGKLLESIKIPAKYVTSAVFGGPNLDILYVTTSIMKENVKELPATSQAGAVFAITGLGAKGLPMHEPIL